MRILKGRHFKLVIVLILIIGFLGCLLQNNGEKSPEKIMLEKTRAAEGLVLKNQCRACHSIDGSRGRGPTWTGLYKSIVTFEGGEKIVADKDYIRESITDPNNKIVSGYLPKVMPQDYVVRMSEPEIDVVVEYLMALD